jgi:hypothetical protein
MTNLQFSLVGNDGEQFITVFTPGRKPMVAHSSHPSFSAIVEGAQAGDESVIDLFDAAETADRKFRRLSERVTARNGRLYLDGEEVNHALSDQVVRFLSEGVDDWKPLVAFYENVQANPNEHSREQLYRWLHTHDFTITTDGMIVGYKGVGGDLLSKHSGKAIVDGEEVSGRIPNKVGSVIEMPRSEVHHNPSVGCSTGLHVGTYDYAQGYAHGGAMLECHVNPRDVVSVPTDSGDAKVRCCRYVVVNVIDAPYSSAVVPSYQWEDEDEEDEDWDDYEWGDGEGDGEAVESQEDEPESDDEPGVRPGDRFRDLDSRRQRVITIDYVNDAGEAFYRNALRRFIGVKIDRLLDPARWERV